jgi:hypothetical protein
MRSKDSSKEEMDVESFQDSYLFLHGELAGATLAIGQAIAAGQNQGLLQLDRFILSGKSQSFFNLCFEGRDQRKTTPL